MEEDVILEIPEEVINEDGEPEWQPPVLKKVEVPEKEHVQSCLDIFFMQYVACILMLTGLFAMRLYDASVFENTIQTFQEHSQMPTEYWMENVLSMITSLWS